MRDKPSAEWLRRHFTLGSYCNLTSGRGWQQMTVNNYSCVCTLVCVCVCMYSCNCYCTSCAPKYTFYCQSEDLFLRSSQIKLNQYMRIQEVMYVGKRKRGQLIVEQIEDGKGNGPFWCRKMPFPPLACSVLGEYIWLDLSGVTTWSVASTSHLQMNPKKGDQTPEADECRTMSNILSGNWFN